MDNQNGNPFQANGQPIPPVPPAPPMPPQAPAQPVPPTPPAQPMPPVPANPAKAPEAPVAPDSATTQPAPPMPPQAPVPPAPPVSPQAPNAPTPPTESPVAPAENTQPASANGMVDFQHIPKPGEQVAPTEKKKKGKLGLIIGIIVGLLVIAGVIIGLLFMFGGSEDEYEDLFDSSAFFIEDKDSHYALFNDDGDQLSEFKFSDAEAFMYGTALVHNIDGTEYGIIDEKGKMTVDFGKYKYIYRVGILYRATNDEYHDIIIDGKGKKIIDVLDGDTITYDDTFVVVRTNNGHKVINYRGKTIVSISDEPDKEPEAKGYEQYGYAVVTHAGVNYVINSMKGELVTQFNSDKSYQVASVDPDSNTVVLKEYDGDDQKIFADGKLTDSLPEGCESVYHYYSDNALVCVTKDKIYLLDSKLQKIGVYSDMSFVSNDTYAVENEDESEESVSFFKGGSKVGTAECRVIADSGKNESDYYLLRTTYSSKCIKNGIKYGRYEYYNTDGKKVLDGDFSSASSFSKSGVAIVANDDGEAYLINTDGKKISDNYFTIYARGNDDMTYYFAYNLENRERKCFILDSEGKVITQFKGYSYNYTVFKEKMYIQIENDEGTYSIYNITDNEKLFDTDASPSFEKHYIIVYGKNKTEYYSYGGKSFYTREE